MKYGKRPVETVMPDIKAMNELLVSNPELARKCMDSVVSEIWTITDERPIEISDIKDGRWKK